MLALIAFALLPVHATAVAAPVPAASSASASLVKIPFTLLQSAYVTMVVDDAQGKRVRNLVAETKFPKGENTVTWDRYDDGTFDKSGNLTRHLVQPGSYTVRGLVHDGIHIRYEFSVYSPGTPPWTTADGSGAWIAEHTPAAGIVYLPQGVSPYGNGAPQMAVGAQAGEDLPPQVWLDLSGRKLHGGMKMDGWFGGRAMCRDLGPNAVGDYYAYGMWLDGKPTTIHLFGLRKPDAPDADGVKVGEIQTGAMQTFNSEHSPVSIAAWNGIMAVSDDLNQKIDFVDIRAKSVIGSVSLPSPRGLCYDSTGHLFAISDGKLLRFDNVDAAHASLGAPQTVVADGFDLPRQVFVDATGRIFISDWGTSHQVKVFSPDGKLVLTIGKAGGGQVGPYDDQQMHSPNGMALDGQGILWVTEDDSLPRRISLWDSHDGHFVKALYGTVGYGGGGTIDPHDPTRFYIADDFQSGGANGGLEFKLDWKTGSSKLASVYMRLPEPPTDSTHPAAAHQEADSLPETRVPERPVTIGRFRYMINTYNANQRAGSSAGVWKLDDNGVAWPVAFAGGGSSWFIWYFEHDVPGQPSEARPALSLLHRDAIKAKIDSELARQHGSWPDAFITWSDTNGNHRMDPDEIQVRVFPYSETAYDPAKPQAFQNYANFLSPKSLDPTDLAYTGAWSLLMPAPAVNADGIPVYDISKAHFAMRPEADWRQMPDGDGGMRFDNGGDGWLIQEPVRGYRNGKLLWTYPMQVANFAPSIPGQIVTANRPLGPMILPRKGDAGRIFAMNSDKGSFYLMTVDGLFVQTLGGDMRIHPLIRDPKMFLRGTLFDDYSFEDELFHPSMTQIDDGNVYLVAGKEHSSIFHVEGLDTIQRRGFGSVTVTAAQVAALPENKIEPGRIQQTRILHVPILSKAPHIFNHLQDWTDDGINEARIDERTTTSVAVSGDRLYAAWRTDDPNLLQHHSGDWRFLFKQGGALDLMVGAASSNDVAHRNAARPGDCRLLVTQVHGAPLAVLYRPVATGATKSESTLFSSPIGRETFDAVEDVSKQVTFSQADGDYEISVPLSALGLSPADGMKISGDIGILRGDGTQTIQRVYWNNVDTSIVSDIPSEARLQPENWGTWQFNVPATPINSTPLPAVTVGTVQPGVSFNVYDGAFNQIPDFSKLTAAETGVADHFHADITSRGDNYGVEFKGYLNVPRDGVYTFHLGSDDGSRLTIDGQTVVNDDYPHGMNDVAAAVALQGGQHAIRVDYFQLTGGLGLSVAWGGPGVNDQEIAPEALSHAAKP